VSEFTAGLLGDVAVKEGSVKVAELRLKDKKARLGQENESLDALSESARRPLQQHPDEEQQKEFMRQQEFQDMPNGGRPSASSYLLQMERERKEEQEKLLLHGGRPTASSYLLQMEKERREDHDKKRLVSAKSFSPGPSRKSNNNAGLLLGARASTTAFPRLPSDAGDNSSSTGTLKKKRPKTIDCDVLDRSRSVSVFSLYSRTARGARQRRRDRHGLTR